MTRIALGVAALAFVAYHRLSAAIESRLLKEESRR